LAIDRGDWLKHATATFPQGRSGLYSLIRSLGKPQSWSVFDEGKISIFIGNRTLVVRNVARHEQDEPKSKLK
jgi:hypothetical protein